MVHVIHCIWLGGPKTKLARKCRASWARFAPEYAVRGWCLMRKDEAWWLRNDAGDEIAIRVPDYVAQAYRAKKWAFASDWLRFVVLAREGGVYFDCDVELVSPLDAGLEAQKVAGREWCALEYLAHGGEGYSCAAMALEKGSAVARRMLAAYESAAFDGETTVGDLMTMNGIGLKGLRPEVFCPFDGKHRSLRTAETIGIHHYVLSWITPQRRVAKWLNWHGLGCVTDFLLKVKRRIIPSRT